MRDEAVHRVNEEPRPSSKMTRTSWTSARASAAGASLWQIEGARVGTHEPAKRRPASTGRVKNLGATQEIARARGEAESKKKNPQRIVTKYANRERGDRPDEDI